MKKLITSTILLLACALAFAMPSPKQIEDALAAKHYTEAKGMIAEVIKQKPDSARAHLLNAYVLIHADHNKAAANAELTTASALDKKGDVKNSPLFGRVVAEIDVQPAQAVKTAKPIPTYQAVPEASPGSIKRAVASQSSFNQVVWGIMGMFLAGILIYMLVTWIYYHQANKLGQSFGNFGNSENNSRISEPNSRFQGNMHQYTDGLGNSGTMRVAASPPPQQVVVQQQPSPVGGGMGIMGTMAGVAGGVVAGNVISDMLLSGHHHNNTGYNNDTDNNYGRNAVDYSNIQQVEPEPVVSTEVERQSFNSSNDNDDSWSRNDTPSYSSSSDDSSSSSWDSGSDSSSSDW
jgi:hypothetical protein